MITMWVKKLVAPIVASSLQIIVGFSGLWAIVARFLSPLSAVPLITLVGLGLYELGFPGVAKCIEIGLPQLIALVFFSQPGKKPIFERFTVIFVVAIVWLYAYFLTVGGAYKHSPQKTQLHCKTDSSGLVKHTPCLKGKYSYDWKGFCVMFDVTIRLIITMGHPAT
ncbi:hypothetical protein SUGI_0453680 [Cryptomeria japonica]|nr:hypothetical protein SUGI_0453680 [Cryptomeria japonica]